MNARCCNSRQHRIREQRASRLRIARAIEGYASGIVRLIGESYGQQTLQKAWREFTMGRSAVFHVDDPNAELFFSWLFHRWAPTREQGHEVVDDGLYGVPPTRAYLDRMASRLDPTLRHYLETCLVTSPGFYEVQSCRTYQTLGLQDAMTGLGCEVWEERASSTVRSGEIIYSHLIPIDEITVMEAISPVSFTSVVKPVIELHARLQPGERAGGALRELYFALLESPESMLESMQQESAFAH